MHPKKILNLYRILQVIITAVETSVVVGVILVFKFPVWFMTIPLGLAVWSILPLFSTKKVAWMLERSSPDVLEERLISYVELSKNLPPYAEPFFKKLESELTARLNWKIALKAIKPNYLSWRITYLIAILGFLNLILKTRPIPYVQIAPKYAEIFEDSTLVLDIFDLPKGGKVIIQPLNRNLEVVRLSKERVKCMVRDLSPGAYRVYAYGPRLQSDTAKILVMKIPVVESLVLVVPRIDRKLELFDPTYVAVRKGVKVFGRLTVVDAESVKVLLDDSEVKEKVEKRNRNLQVVSFEFKADSSGRLRFELRKGILKALSPREVRIDVVEDEPPYVAFIRPKFDIDLPDNGIVPTVGFAEDDFGLEKIVAFVEFRGEKRQMDYQLCHGEPVDTVKFNLDLNGLGMMPGDAATVTLGAQDIGGHWSFSQPITVRFPTLEELYERTAETAQSGQRDVEHISARLDELSKKMKEMQEMLRANRELSWEERQKAQQILEQAQAMLDELNQKIENIQNALQKIQELSLDPELSQKIQELSELFEQIIPDSLKKRLEELSKALETQRLDEIDQLLSQLQVDQELLKQQLDQLHSILKQFEEEMKLKEFAERLEDLAAQQDLLTQDLLKADKSQFPELSSEQQQLWQQMDSLLKEMQNFALDSTVSREIRDTLSELAQTDGQNVLNQMQMAQAQIAQGNKKSAMRSQKKAKEQLLQLAERLKDFRQALVDSRKSQLLREIQALQLEALTLSELQENILRDARVVEFSPAQLANRQMGIQRALSRLTQNLVSLGKNSFFISPKLIGTFAKASNMASPAAGFFERNRIGQGTLMAESTLKYINLGIYELMETQQQIENAQSSTGMQQLMSQLNQMMQQQNQITMGTQSLLPLPSPIPSALMQQLQQLAEAQAQLASQLQELSSQIGERMLSEALQEAAREAEDIAKQLRQGQVDRELVERQKDITEKLLDAQRALKKREFVQKRKAETGHEVPTESPAPIRELAERERLKNALLNVRRYPQAYRKFIEAYYKTLLEGK